MGAFGDWAAIIPGALAFGLLHLLNPNASWLGAINTIGFGVVFGYAFSRSRDLWLPIGLHFGWNLTLPLFGATLSGLRINVTGYEMSWTAGKLWSGGDYGPEAGLWTSVVVLLMFAAVRKGPVRRQAAPIAGPPIGSEVCEPPSFFVIARIRPHRSGYSRSNLPPTSSPSMIASSSSAA